MTVALEEEPPVYLVTHWALQAIPFSVRPPGSLRPPGDGGGAIGVAEAHQAFKLPGALGWEM